MGWVFSLPVLVLSLPCCPFLPSLASTLPIGFAPSRTFVFSLPIEGFAFPRSVVLFLLKPMGCFDRAMAPSKQKMQKHEQAVKWCTNPKPFTN